MTKSHESTRLTARELEHLGGIAGSSRFGATEGRNLLRLVREHEELSKALKNVCRLAGISVDAAMCLADGPPDLTSKETQFGQSLRVGAAQPNQPQFRPHASAPTKRRKDVSDPTDEEEADD